jgi:hypothetical protein
MAARLENTESRKLPALPETAKELIFWCAVLVAVVSGAVLIGSMDALWRFPIPSAQSATVVASPKPVTDPKLTPGLSPNSLRQVGGKAVH